MCLVYAPRLHTINHYDPVSSNKKHLEYEDEFPPLFFLMYTYTPSEGRTETGDLFRASVSLNLDWIGWRWGSFLDIEGEKGERLID